MQMKLIWAKSKKKRFLFNLLFGITRVLTHARIIMKLTEQSEKKMQTFTSSRPIILRPVNIIIIHLQILLWVLVPFNFLISTDVNECMD
jgi:hypothetical protein